jgi:bacterioferritin (cytochrome b1)
MEEILAKEEEHAEDLKSLIETISQAEKQWSEKGDQNLRRAS